MRDGFIKVAAAVPEIRVADCAYNADRCVELMRQAAAEKVKILVFPELCLTGATCGDLFFHDILLDGAEQALEQVVKASEELDMLVVVGLPVRGTWKKNLYNCAAVVSRGEIKGLVPKQHLTAAESRWFVSGEGGDSGMHLCGRDLYAYMSVTNTFACKELPDLIVGVEVGEDLWAPAAPSVALAQMGATLIVNPCAMSEQVGRAAYQRGLVESQSGRLNCAYLSAGAGEGESTTDLVFGGHCLIAEDGQLLAERRFESGLTVSEVDVAALQFDRRRPGVFEETGAPTDYSRCLFSLQVEETPLTRPMPKNPFVPEDREELKARCSEMLTMAALGLKKRLSHTYAKTAVVGLSGGLDSTLALLITARAMEMLGRPMTDIVAITMPCFGTTSRTKSNAQLLAERIGADFRTIDIGDAVRVHFKDIGQSMDDLSVTFENGQARERTQVLMDVANREGGMVIGTGDLSELALGWATYNGDHMSMYAVNGGIPKTMVRHLTAYVASEAEERDPQLAAVLRDILATPVSPELLPPKEGEIAQKTEDLVGPYELHDFFLYYVLRRGFSPAKIYRLALAALEGEYDRATILKWLKNFYRRFFTQQFKRSCLPDGPKVGSVTVSPRGGLTMPSDAVSALWMAEVEKLG